jgi:alpha-beta hydrolase superfamily lysophospholipase
MTPLSFEHIINSLPDHNEDLFAYDATAPLLETCDRLQTLLTTYPEKVHLVGHSLGGVISLFAALRSDNVESITTIASPLGGCEVSRVPFASHFSPVLANVHPNHPVYQTIRSADRIDFDRITSIIATNGRTYPGIGQTDGVVSLASQRAVWYANHVEIGTNHFEVLLHQETINTIVETVFDS